MKTRQVILVLSWTVLLAGCSGGETGITLDQAYAAAEARGRQALFVVLPSEGGGAGAITVDDGKTVTTLDQPYAAAESRAGSSRPVEESRGDISVIFRRAIAAQPILPHHFRLCFILASGELTPESVTLYRSAFDDIKERPVYQVEVVGHTDTLGDLRVNQALSVARAAAIRNRLVQDGVDRNAISIAGRGKFDPIIPTGDNVAEPRNRCVVVTVR